MSLILTNPQYINQRRQKPPFILHLILFLLQIKISISVVENSCYQVYDYENEDCFNDKIKFHNNFRAGHFVTLKDGSLIIEYSSDAVNYERFFYGLKKNGRYYFENESAFKRFKVTNPQNELHGRYESENKIVYLSGDTNKENEYIFSTSIWTTTTELHDIQRNLSSYWDTNSFWTVVEIFSYEINILDLPEAGENRYLAVFTQHETDKRKVDGEDYDYSKTWSFRKFKFDTFDTFTPLGTKYNYTSNYNSRMISAFIVYDWSTIVVFFLKKADEEYTNAYYTLAFFNYDLEWKCEVQKNWVSEPHSGDGIFFRSFLIKDRWAAFLYFTDKSGNKLTFEVGELAGGDDSRKFEYRIQKTFDNLGFDSDIRFNDFFKVDEKRFVMVTTKPKFKSLIFVIFDLFNNFYNYRIRAYYYDNVNDELWKEMQGYTYNGYIIFTFVSKPSDLFSTLLFFGYANGTDFQIDISPYLMDTGYYNSNNNLYNRLVETAVIDNNIFGYQFVPKINLVYYPDELLFYNGSGSTKETNKLPFNSFFDANHTLYQNRALNKTHKLYYIEYQFIVKEPPRPLMFIIL